VFLNPKFTSVIFEGMKGPMVEACEEVLQSSSGKVSFDTVGLQDQRQIPLLLNKIADRLSQLQCEPKILTDDEALVKKLKLEYYGPNNELTMGQMDVLLRFLKIAQLRLNLFEAERYVTTLTDLDCNYSIQHLALTFYGCSTQTLDEFFPRLLKCCPNLQELELCIYYTAGNEEEELDSDQVVQQALQYCRWYNEVKTQFAKLDSFEFVLNYTQYCASGQYDNFWRNELKQRAEFMSARDAIYEDDDYIRNELRIENADGKHYEKISVQVCYEIIHQEELGAQ